MAALTEVGVPCRHPGTPHEGHTVHLRPHIGLEGGLAAEAVLVEPFDVEAVLGDYGLARNVADMAGDLYTPEVMAPFQVAPAKTSPTGPTGASTSPAPTSIQTRRRRSSRATTAASRR
jgi:hypothetical protein